MDKKKRTIYITIIILCLIGTAAILFVSNSGPAAPTAEELAGPVSTNPPTASAAASGDLTATDYPIPAVFPAEDSFSTAILNSSKIQSLTNYNPVVVSGEEVNREDPFARY